MRNEVAELEIVGSASIQDHKERVRMKDAQYWKYHARKTRRLNPRLKSLRGLNAAINASIACPNLGELNEKWQLKFVDDPHIASVFIVEDVSKAGSSSIIRLSLIGGVLMSWTAYETLGKSGVLLQHEAFLKSKKTWFLSQGFRD